MTYQHFFLCRAGNWELHIGNVPLLYQGEQREAIDQVLGEHLAECDEGFTIERFLDVSFK